MIVFASLRDRQWETWRVRAEGGPDEKITDGFFRGDWMRQPNGNGTLLVSSLVGGGGIRVIDFERRNVLWEQRFEGAGASLPMFSPDGRFISEPRHEGRDRDAIWLYETATGKGRVAVSFAEPFQYFFAPAGWTTARHSSSIGTRRFDTRPVRPVLGGPRDTPR